MSVSSSCLALELKKAWTHNMLVVRTSFLQEKMNPTSKITLMLKKRDKLSEEKIIQENP